jgi:DNA polymerase IV
MFLGNLEFNPSPLSYLHLDINSCFATVEQQFNPKIRHRPVVVAAYTTNNGCVLASSWEAKLKGIKTGMRVREARFLCPGVVVLPSDPPKYRFIHSKFRTVLADYTDDFQAKSIDEFCLNVSHLSDRLDEISFDIKRRIKKEIGDYITVSIGLAPNSYLAKVASGLQKPDGFTKVDIHNVEETFAKMALRDLTGIARGNESALNKAGIYTVMDFYRANRTTLRSAFGQTNGLVWYLRLRGWENHAKEKRSSFSSSHVVAKPLDNFDSALALTNRLTDTMVSHMTQAGYGAFGVGVSFYLVNRQRWHSYRSFPSPACDVRLFLKSVSEILREYDFETSIRSVAVACFNLQKRGSVQLDLWGENIKREGVVDSMEKVQLRFGRGSIFPAKLLVSEQNVVDRIGFGRVREL